MSNSYDSTTVHHILKNGTKQEILEKLQCKINLHCTSENGDTVMHAILRNGKLKEKDVTEILTYFITQGVDPNIVNKNEQVTVLHLAVGRRMKYTVDILVNFNADIQIVNTYGNSIAHFFVEDEYENRKQAVSNDSVSYLEFLISKGVNFYSKNKQGESALHLAITYRLLHILPILLEKTNVAMYNDNDKKTLLELFVEGNTSMERSHLSDEHRDPGYDPEHVDKILRILLDLATNMADEEYVCTLISKMIREKRETSIIETLINYYLNKYADMNFATSLFHELINTSASWDIWQTDYFLTVLWDLVAQGVIVNNQLSQKRLVITAMEAKNIRLLEFLKDNGVDFGLRFAHGKKLLHLIAEQRDLVSSGEFRKNFCNFLFCCGCDVEATNNRGKTALHTAAGNGNVPVVVALIELGAEINRRDNDMKTPLHEALMMDESIELIKLLVSNGADVNAKDYKHEMPLHIAVSIDDLTTVQLLIEHGASVNATDKCLQTPLHRALARNSSVEMIELLLTCGADVNVRDEKGNRPLHHIFEDSVFKGSFRPDRERVMTVLLKHGAHVNSKNNEGRSALFGALYCENFAMADELLKYGADMNDSLVREMMRTSRHSISPHLGIFFQRHWIKLRAADMPFDEDVRAFMNGNDDLQYYDECSKEIEKLKNTFIDDSKSVYNFLHMGPERGRIYVNCEKMKELVQLPKLDEQFPKYAVIILANYHKAKVFETREKVLNAMNEIFIELYNVSVEKVVEKIIKYLQDEDLCKTLLC